MVARLLSSQSLQVAPRVCSRGGFRNSYHARGRAGPTVICQASGRDINGAGYSFRPASTDEEWLQLDAKVNKYPSKRTFKAIGVGGQEFVDSMVDAVQRATNQPIDRPSQVSERPSKQGSYLAVSISKVTVTSGQQVLGVFREMKSSGGDRLKFII